MINTKNLRSYFSNLLFIIFQILFSKRINLINNSFQFINFVELISLEKFKSFEIPKIIFIAYPASKKNIKQIYESQIALKQKSIKIIPLEKYLNFQLFNFIFKLRKIFFFNFQQVVIGDFNYHLFDDFRKNSDSSILIDDGTSTLDKNTKFKLDQEKTIVFTFVNKEKINLEHAVIIENNYLYLRKIQIKEQILENTVLIVGCCFVEIGYMTTIEYFRYLEKILNSFSDSKCVYLPHPRESLKKFEKFRNLDIIEESLPVELYLSTKKNLPKVVVGGYTTSFFTIKKIYNDKIDLKACFVRFLNQDKHNVFERHKLIESFIKQNFTSIKFYNLVI